MFWFVPGGPHKINTFLSNILKGNSRQPVEGGEQSPAAAAAFVFSEAVVGQSEEQFSRSRIKQVSPAQPRWRPGPRQAPSLYLTCSSLGAGGGLGVPPARCPLLCAAQGCWPLDFTRQDVFAEKVVPLSLALALLAFHWVSQGRTSVDICVS